MARALSSAERNVVLGSSGEVVNRPEGDEAEDDGKATFNGEDPSPAGKVADAMHVLDGSGEEATERACDACCEEEEGLEWSQRIFCGRINFLEVLTYSSKTEFGSLVPTRQIKTDARKGACLS